MHFIRKYYLNESHYKRLAHTFCVLIVWLTVHLSWYQCY